MVPPESETWMHDSYLSNLMTLLKERGIVPERDYKGLFWLDLGCGNNDKRNIDNFPTQILVKPELIEEMGRRFGKKFAIGIDYSANTEAESYHHVIYWLSPEETTDQLLSAINQHTNLQVQKEQFWGVSAIGLFTINNPSPTLEEFGNPRGLGLAVWRWAGELVAPEGFLIIDRKFYQKQKDGKFELLS